MITDELAGVRVGLLGSVVDLYVQWAIMWTMSRVYGNSLNILAIREEKKHQKRTAER